ncbi:MAG TPA: hypothetical protein GXX14_03970 [Clostridiaceae bacterium]|nr:hypothetical protein [Clostridiaceae bacterium]
MDRYVDRYKKLEAIANGFYAASRIQKALNSDFETSPGTSVRSSTLDKIYEVFNIIDKYSPESYRRNVSDIVKKSFRYSRAYKDIKQHLYSARNKKADKDMFINTLKVLKPILSNKQIMLVDKFIKITEILYS